MLLLGERLGRGIVTDAITTPVVNTSAYFFKKTAELIDFKVSIILFFASGTSQTSFFEFNLWIINKLQYSVSESFKSSIFRSFL